MRQHTAVIALFLFGGVFVLGLLALASMLGPGVSQADDATMHNCPQPNRWAVAVWGGDEGTNADQAFATCGEGAVIAAYDLDPQTQGWSRWFADQPDISTLSTLDKWQGVIALGGAEAPATPTPSPMPSPTPTPTVFMGQDDKSTPVFEVTHSPFRIGWTTQSDSPIHAMFGFFVYPQGETAVFECMAFYDAEGSDYTVCHAPPGRYWLEVLAANLTSWQIEIGPAPPTSNLPVTFTGKDGSKDTPMFHVSGSSFIVAWTVESYSPKDAHFSVYVYPEGERRVDICDFAHDGIGSASGVCDAGPGDYYLATLAGYLTSWRLDITEP